MDELAITLDIDWAPDFMIDAVGGMLADANVKATWFVTHASPAVDRLRSHRGLFELGIHPNFLPGTTHGNSPDEILSHCLGIVPDATSLRTHGLAWSSLLFELVLDRPQLSVDVSLFAPMAPALRPLEFWWRKSMLLRCPYYWEDSCEMSKPSPTWSLASLRVDSKGLKIFNFHPVHVFLNTHDFDHYRSIKANAGDLKSASPHLFAAPDNQAGARTLFTELLKAISLTGGGTTVREIGERWRMQAAVAAVG